MILQAQPRSKAPIITWEPLPADFFLPDDPMENIQQPPLAAALTDALGAANHIQPEMLLGSNFGLVATVNRRGAITKLAGLGLTVEQIAEALIL